MTSHESSSSDDDLSNPDISAHLDANVFNDIPTQTSSDSIKNWLQRITDMQHEIQKKYGESSVNGPSISTVSRFISLTSLFLNMSFIYLIIFYLSSVLLIFIFLETKCWKRHLGYIQHSESKPCCKIPRPTIHG